MKLPGPTQLARFFPLFGRHRRAFFENLPETQLFPDDRSRSEAVSKVHQKVDGNRAYVYLHPVALFAGFFVSYWVLGTLFPTLGPWNAAIASIASILVLEFIFYSIARDLAAAGLRADLIESGIAVCHTCGYDLRHLDASSSSRCPECGANITDEVRRLIDADAGRTG